MEFMPVSSQLTKNGAIAVLVEDLGEDAAKPSHPASTALE